MWFKMRLRQLIEGLGKVETVGSLDREVNGIAYNSRCVTPGKVFVAIRGAEADGHNYIADAIERGAVAIVCERKGTSGGKVARVVVPNTRKALSIMAETFYGHPSSMLKMVGVTGTNGKTTTTFLAKGILEKAGIRTGLLGTIRYEIGDQIIPAQRTTPESLEIHQMLSKLLAAKGECCVMEVSSHALEQRRVAGIQYNTGVFTNLTRDHLDYHKTMEQYFESKKRLFTEGACERGKFNTVINVDDPFGRELLGVLKGSNLFSYGLREKADISATDIKLSPNKTTMKVHAFGDVFNLETPLIGRYNVLNTLAAIGIALSLGVKTDVIAEALVGVQQVPGRLERVEAGQPFSVLVDYAHTDDALLNVMTTMREITEGRLLLAFGCGGSRDTGKRFKMGEVAARLADYTVITTDNPRKEEPAAIAAQIEEGYRSFRLDGYEVELDRTLAIERIIEMAGARDTVLLCGKGHETYQEFSRVVVPFDDRQHVLSALENRGYRIEIF